MICDDCRGKPNEHECTHKMASHRPPWKPVSKFGLVRAMYADRTTLLKRESMGQVSDDINVAFAAELLKRFYARPGQGISEGLDPMVFVACDPNGGGTSHMSIVSAIYVKGEMLVSLSPPSSGVGVERWGWEGTEGEVGRDGQMVFMARQGLSSLRTAHR